MIGTNARRFGIASMTVRRWPAVLLGMLWGAAACMTAAGAEDFPGALEVPNQSTSPSLRKLLASDPPGFVQLPDRYSIAGVEIRVTPGIANHATDGWTCEQVTIRRGEQVLARWPSNHDDARSNATWFGLAPLIAQPDSQLVLIHTDGGAHCCLSMRIYSLHPTLRLLFDSESYSYSDGHGDWGWSDLDGDQVPEVVINDGVFAFGPSSMDRFVPLIFKYDRVAKRYRLANRAFSALLLRDVNSDDLVSFMLANIYTGSRDEAWRAFERHPDQWPYVGDELARRQNLETLLDKDKAYRELYPAPR